MCWCGFSWSGCRNGRGDETEGLFRLRIKRMKTNMMEAGIAPEILADSTFVIRHSSFVIATAR